MLTAILLSAVMIVVSFSIHLVAFIQTTRWTRPERHPIRCFALGAVLITIAHLIEAFLFALCFWGGERLLSIGELKAASPDMQVPVFADYFYFSMVNFSTLGRGDLVPTGHLRFITAIEAFVGFLLITTSGAFLLTILSGRTPIAAGSRDPRA